jgi:iron complex outermembrane receptor protein
MNHSTSRIRAALLLAGSAAALSWAAPALAQDTTPETAANAAGTTVDELVVTARRREENLKDVPIAVTALSAQRLENIGAKDITTLQQTTPNATVQVARGSNSTLIAFIRGVGQQDPLWGFDSGVGLYVDDVYYARPQAAVLDVYDVERIEVLRGPQGTLYGRNTVGGAIKYVTKPLGTDTEFHGRAEYGSYNQLDLLASAKAPIFGDKLAIGAAAERSTHDGYGTNLFTGADQYDKDLWAARGTIEARPWDNWLFRLSADIVHDDSNPRHGHREVPTSTVGGAVLPDVYDTNAGIGDDNEVENRGVSLLTQWDISDLVTFKSITAYRAGETDTVIDFDNTPLPILDIPAFYSDHQFTQELQLTYNGDRVQGVAGLFYMNSAAAGAFDTIGMNLLPGLGLTIADAGHVDTRSWSAYADFSMDVTDRLKVSLGGRYTHDDKEASVFRAFYLGLDRSPYTGGVDRPAFAIRTNYPTLANPDVGKATFKAFTPRASISYKFTPELTGYASYSRGFKSGGFDMRGDAVAYPDTILGYEPEYVDSYEIGLKGSLFDGRVNFATDVFYMTYTDMQITTQYPAPPTVASVVDNVGKASMYGWELEGAAHLTDDLRIDTAIGYIHTQFDEYLAFIPGAPGNGFACAPNPPKPNSAAGCFVDVKDQRALQNTPEWTGNVSLTWTHDLAGGQLAFTPVASYRGAFQMFETPTLLDQGGYWLFDANISWTSPDGRYTLGAHGRNLSDERYRTGGYNFPGAAFQDSITAYYGPPRTFSISLDARF